MHKAGRTGSDDDTKAWGPPESGRVTIAPPGAPESGQTAIPVRAQSSQPFPGTDRAFVDDWGRIFSGRAAIKNWSSVEFIGSAGVLTPQTVSTEGATVTVTGDWRSNHANGLSEFMFTLEAGKISSMTIREG